MLYHFPKKPELSQIVPKQNRSKDKNVSYTSEHEESSDGEEQGWTQRLRCQHHHGSPEESVAPSIGPDQSDQPECSEDTQELTMDTHELRADAEEFRMDTLPNQDTEMDISQPTETFPSPDQPSGVVGNQLSDTVLRRSQRDRRPRERLTYDALGQPVQRVVGLTASPLYASAVSPLYGHGQYRIPWIAPRMPFYPTLVPVSYY